MRLNSKELLLANITNLLYLSVLAGAVFLVFIGVWLGNKITDSAEQKARIYQTAVQTKDDKQFNYSIDTKQGRILAEVTIKAVDLVKFPEMNKSFPKVRKTEERYTQHEHEVCETEYRTETRTETVTDKDGDTHTEEVEVEVPYEECHSETYYSWDTTNEWEESAKEVEMASRKYPIDKFSLGTSSIDAKDIIDGQTGQYVIVESKGVFNLDIDILEEADEGDLRYSYDVLQLPKSGTVFLNVSEGVQPVFGGLIALEGQKPAELVKNSQKSAQTQSTVFTIFWGVFILVELIGGGYLVYQSPYNLPRDRFEP